MLEGQKAALATAAALGVFESALTAVAFPDLPRDFHGNVARLGLKLSALARLARSEAALHLALEQLVERALENHGKIATRDRVAQELPRLLELGAKLGARGKFNSVALGRERLDTRSRRASCPGTAEQ